MKKLFSISIPVTIAAMAMTSLTATTASAQSGDTVAFGDSFLANPALEQVQNQQGNLSSLPTNNPRPGGVSPQGCPQGDTNVPRELARISGQNVINYACSAASASGNSHRLDLYEQVDHAIAGGAVGTETKNVLIQIGANDTTQTAFLVDPTRRQYKDALRSDINKIRAAAPNAKITLVTYPAISAANGALCPIRVEGSSNQGFNLDALALMRGLENTLSFTMFETAQENDVSYYDLRSASLAHNMCSPDSMRWVAGGVESTQPYNIGAHLTHVGNVGVAQLLNDNVIVR